VFNCFSGAVCMCVCVCGVCGVCVCGVCVCVWWEVFDLWRRAFDAITFCALILASSFEGPISIDGSASSCSRLPCTTLHSHREHTASLYELC
jgi:hypothetical protein